MLMVTGKTPKAVRDEILKWIEWHGDCQHRASTMATGKKEAAKAEYASKVLYAMKQELEAAVVPDGE